MSDSSLSTSSKSSFSKRLPAVMWSIGTLVGIMWVLELLDTILRLNLEQYGIHPRSVQHWYGILAAPFLHSSWQHLWMNTLPFIIFGSLIAIHCLGDLWVVSGITALVSGIGVWLIAPSYSVTVGASGVIFGYFSFLLFRGIFERNLTSLFVSVAIAVLYGSLVWQVFPTHPQVSWQAHLFGFLGGILAASLYRLPEE